MFKQASFEDELYRSMEKTLVKNQTENKHGFNKLAKAADLLNTAADIFDRAGMHKESEEIAQILQSVAIDLIGPSGAKTLHDMYKDEEENPPNVPSHNANMWSLINVNGVTLPKLVIDYESSPRIGERWEEDEGPQYGPIPYRFVLETRTGTFLVRVKDGRTMGVEEL